MPGKRKGSGRSHSLKVGYARFRQRKALQKRHGSACADDPQNDDEKNQKNDSDEGDDGACDSQALRLPEETDDRQDSTNDPKDPVKDGNPAEDHSKDGKHEACGA